MDQGFRDLSYLVAKDFCLNLLLMRFAFQFTAYQFGTLLLQKIADHDVRKPSLENDFYENGLFSPGKSGTWL